MKNRLCTVFALMMLVLFSILSPITSLANTIEAETSLTVDEETANTAQTDEVEQPQAVQQETQQLENNEAEATTHVADEEEVPLTDALQNVVQPRAPDAEQLEEQQMEVVETEVATASPNITITGQSAVGIKSRETDELPLEGNTFDQYAKIKVSMDFALPNNQLAAGDTSVISLPDALRFASDEKFDVTDSEGKVVAKAFVNVADKTVTLTYTDYVTQKSDITGKLEFVTMVDSTVQTTDGQIPLTFDVDRESVTAGIVDYKFKGDNENEKFTKYGSFVAGSTTRMQNVIRVNTSGQEKGTSYDNVVIHDELGLYSMSFVPGTFVIRKGQWTMNDQSIWVFTEEVGQRLPESVVKYTEDGKGFTINLGNVSANDEYSIFYETVLDHDAVPNKKYPNSAEMLSNGKQVTSYTHNHVYQAASGQASGYDYKIKIVKTGEDGEKLEGAVFDIIRGTTNASVGKVKTDANGVATVTSLLKDTYTIKEVTAPEGYELSDQTYTITPNDFGSTLEAVKTITNKKIEATKIAINVQKAWDDANNQDGKRPEAIQVQLYADGEKSGDAVTLNAANNWKHTFADLDEKANGQAINYTVKEVTNVDGYTTTINDKDKGNIIITNKYTPATTEVAGTKTWNDANDQDGKRPESITVNLLADGEKVEVKEVTAENEWKYSFKDLPKYANGKEIVYTVMEDAVADYTSEIDGFNITNSYTPGKTSVTVTKAWDDANNQDGKRPASIEVQLYADGKASGEKVTLNAANNWTYTFAELAKKANGQAINYTVKEVTKVEGYTTTINDEDKGNVIITNKYTPATTEVAGMKTWDDANDQDGKRPESITVNLLADGKEVADKKVTVTAKDEWKYSFKNLPKYANGQEIVYTVTEDTVEGYTTAINGFDITNKYTPGKTGVTVTKAWDDANDQDGKRPAAIDVQLYANDETSGDVVTLNAANNWTYTFAELAEKANGQAINYTVKETTKVEGYTTTINDENKGNIIITNSYKPETTEVAGAKTWNDANDQDGKRPESITVNLLADGKEVADKKVTVTAKDEWKYSFTNLPKYNAGQAIIYTITEDTVADYTTVIDGYNITNSYTPGKTGVTVTKAWDDANDQDGKRPSSINVQLYADDNKSGDEVTLNAANNWTYTFAELAEKANGQAINYTVKETTKIDGYTTTINDENKGNIIITNSYKPATTEVSGTKTWDDANNQDGKRPESITVNLLADGKEVAEKVVTSKDEWKYNFTNLPKYNAGKAIVYTVTEDAVANYATVVKGFDITNSYTPGKTSFTVTKAWDDANNQDGKRSEAIDVQLYANDQAVGEVVTVKATNNWTHTWTDLAQKTNGQDIIYTVKEVNVPTGYTATVAGNVITNTYTPETTTVDVVKEWDDLNDAAGKRPGSITVNLFADGEKSGEATVTAENDWKYSFTNLPKYKEGKEIVYTITENAVPSYETTIDGFTMTNRYVKTVVEENPPAETPNTPEEPTTPEEEEPTVPEEKPTPVVPTNPVTPSTPVVTTPPVTTTTVNPPRQSGNVVTSTPGTTVVPASTTTTVPASTTTYQAAPATEVVTKQGLLPQTGDRTTAVTFAGIALLIGALALLLVRKRRMN